MVALSAHSVAAVLSRKMASMPASRAAPMRRFW
jgi:hypothetical protein